MLSRGALGIKRWHLKAIGILNGLEPKSVIDIAALNKSKPVPKNTNAEALPPKVNA
jgi:hypothetical protein